MRTKHRKTLAWAAACAAVSTSWLHAQTVHNFTGGNTGNGINWQTDSNWDNSTPNAPDALAQFGSKTGSWSDLININFASAVLSGTAEVSAIVFLPTFELGPEGMTIRNSSSSTAGTMKIYGHSTMIDGDPATLLIGNYSSPASGPIRFGLNTNQGYALELNSSGVIHNEGGLLRISNQITEAGGTRSITKTGTGTLRLDDHSTDGGASVRHSTANSTYSGGFTLREGIVEWSAGGGLSASPFGTGALTLQGGNLRSTTTDSQTISNNVVLNGDIAFGSLSETFNGDIAINDANGERATVLASNSTLTVHNQVLWNQAISGDFNLTKSGAGTLVLSGAGGEVSHTGATVVEEGRLLVNTGIAASEVTVESGATLGFGTADSTGQGTFGNSLTLEADSFLSFRLNSSNDFDSLLALGEVGLNGAILDISLGFAPEVNDVFLLLDNQSGESLNGFLSYGGGVLAEGSEFTVTTGEFSQLFAITYQFNGDSLALTAIPEPSTWVLILGLASFGAAAWRRRR